MVHHPPTLAQVEQELRTRICAGCPLRTACIPGAGLRRQCEATCSLFRLLPALKHRADQLDPLVGHHQQALAQWITEMIEAQPPAPRFSPLRLHQRQAATILSRFLNR